MAGRKRGRTQPGTAVSMSALVPILLAVSWFELAAGLGTATVATLLFLGDNLLTPSAGLAGGTLVLGAVNRSLVSFGVAVLVTLLLRREDTETQLPGGRVGAPPGVGPEALTLESGA